MVSFATIRDPHDSEMGNLERYSSSLYWNHDLSPGWNFKNTFIFGAIRNYDHTHWLSSFGEEFLVDGGAPKIWGRIEVLQRTAAELAILPSNDRPVWVGAVTLGYTHRLLNLEAGELNVGGSVTKDILPEAFKNSYGGNPWSAKAFLQLTGMKMGDL